MEVMLPWRGWEQQADEKATEAWKHLKGKSEVHMGLSLCKGMRVCVSINTGYWGNDKGF